MLGANIFETPCNSRYHSEGNDLDDGIGVILDDVIVRSLSGHVVDGSDDRFQFVLCDVTVSVDVIEGVDPFQLVHDCSSGHFRSAGDQLLWQQSQQ